MKVGLIGAGLIGKKRLSALDENDQLVGIYELNELTAGQVSSDFHTQKFESELELINEVGADGLIIVATNHKSLAPAALSAIRSGCHVLIEKPGARNFKEFEAIVNLAQDLDRVVRVGFNHRFHPSFLKLKQIVETNTYGEVQLVRSRYGHGGRRGYEKEWRASKDLSGGGELLDQGSHLLDLVQFLFEDYSVDYACLENLYWDMPVEDNAFISGRLANNGKIWLHASWTEWKNLFSFEVFFKTAKVEIFGLGGSYGPETITIHHMEDELGPPVSSSIQFPTLDKSWNEEMTDVKKSILGKEYIGADGNSTLAILNHIETIYNS